MDKIHRQLIVAEIIKKLEYFVQEFDIDSLFILGDYPRYLYFNNLWEVERIEVVSAYPEQAQSLGRLFSTEVMKLVPDKNNEVLSLIIKSEYGDIELQFQGKSTHAYMYNSEVLEWMRQHGFIDIPLFSNLMGRDFTINALVFSFKNKKLLDPMERAEADIQSKTLKSLLPANLLIKYNPICILSAIRYAVKYGLHIEPELRSAMREGKSLLEKNISKDRISKEIASILTLDSREGLALLQKYNLLKKT